jgi:arginase
VDEVRFRGLQTCVKEALNKLSNCDLIYNFEFHGPMISYGTGTPVPKGFDQQVTTTIKSRKVICFEVVEVNPLLDTKGNKMAETAFEVLEQITSTVILPLE